MDQIFGVPTAAFMGQLMLGLVNGSFYALLSLGLAVIFGMLNIVNFAHGALYMTGAFFAWMLLNYAGVNYWFALLLAPIGVGIIGLSDEKIAIVTYWASTETEAQNMPEVGKILATLKPAG